MEIVGLLIGFIGLIFAVYFGIKSHNQGKIIHEQGIIIHEQGIKTQATLDEYITDKSKYLKGYIKLYSNSKERIYALTTAWNMNSDLQNCFSNSNVEEVVFGGPINLPTIGRVLWRKDVIKKRRPNSSVFFFHADMNTIGLKFIIGDSSALFSDSRDTTDGSSKGLLVTDAPGEMLSFLETHFSNVLKNHRTEQAVFRIDNLIWSFIRNDHGVETVNIDQIVSSLVKHSIFSSNKDEMAFLEKLYFSYIEEMIKRGKIIRVSDKLIRCISPDLLNLLEMNEYCSNCLLLETFERRYPNWREILDKSTQSLISLSLAAVLYNLSKDYNKAIDAADIAIKTYIGKKENLAILHNNMGHALKEYQLLSIKNSLNNTAPNNIVNYFKEVKYHFEKAIELDPNFLTAKKNIGIMYFRIAENLNPSAADRYWKKSEEYLTQFAEASQNKFEGFYSLARFYGVRNQEDKACEEIKKILEIRGHQFKEWYTSKEFIANKYKTDREYYFSKIKTKIDKLLDESSDSIIIAIRQ